MKQILFFLIFLIVETTSYGQQEVLTPVTDIIPKPVECSGRPGFFILHPGEKIYAPAEFTDAALLLTELLGNGSTAVSRPKGAGIRFVKAELSDSLGDEGYSLHIDTAGITVGAASPAGAIHAAFTLLQLRMIQPVNDRVPCADIKDRPRFSYRGMHLDVSRNFFPVSFIKKYIDLMALYRYNYFHWHLTDGPGWRLEIKKYPQLTEIAAFRTHRTWSEWWKTDRRYGREGEPDVYGGYYTQEEAREVVAYAARRGITVIPEIEMPGHSEEVLAVMPQLSCSGKPYSGGEFCIGNPETFVFLEDVLSEVISVFPSPYIHIGGDEASTASWARCGKCQELKKEKGLKDESELQAYLIKHMEEYLKSKGRKLIGWDEIVDGGLPAEATVMSWRGLNGGIKAAQAGHDVVMTPGETYLDAYQSDPSTQPEAIGGFLPISRVYGFDPLPQGLTPEQEKHILGTQANLWTEYMPTTYQVEYMAWPRAAALAEVAWSRKEARDFSDFHRRLQSHYRLLQRMNVNYYRPSSFLTVTAMPDYSGRSDLVTVSSERYRPEIRYTVDGSDPDTASPLYAGPFRTTGKTTVRAAVFSQGRRAGEVAVYDADYHRAIGKKVIFSKGWSDAYPAQKEQTLTNGIRGSLTYGDRQWLGLLDDFDVTVDMDSVTPINTVSVKFMHQPGPGVFLPTWVELQLSDDGQTFRTVKREIHDFDPADKKLAFKTFIFDCSCQSARYIRITGPNGMKGFMFADEIVVY